MTPRCVQFKYLTNNVASLPVLIWRILEENESEEDRRLKMEVMKWVVLIVVVGVVITLLLVIVFNVKFSICPAKFP